MSRTSLLSLSAAGLLFFSGCHCCDWCRSACCNKRSAPPCDPCAGPAVPPPPGAPVFAPQPPAAVQYGPSADVVVPAQRPAYYYGGSIYRPNGI